MITEEENNDIEAECAECNWKGAICDMEEDEELQGFMVCPKCNGENIFYH